MISPAWPKARLGSLTTKIGSGATPRGGDSAYKESGVPLIRSMNVYDLSFDRKGLAFIDDQQAMLLDNVEVQAGDVLLNITGASVARCCLVPPELTGARVNQHVAILRGRADRLDGRFLAYVLVSHKFKNELLNVAGGGATREALTKGGLERFEVPAPPYSEQRRIASILGAYDDLIEVNRRRVAVLEAMARGLFEEWFVRFRFPGHENHKVIDTPDGPLPEGWRIGAVGDIAKLRSGFAFKSASFVEDGQFGLVTIKHVQDGNLQPPFDSRIAAVPNGMPPYCAIDEGDLLLSLTGNVGRICLAWGHDLLLNQRVAKVDPTKPYYRAFAYGLLRSAKTKTILENISNGAAQQNLSPIRAMQLPEAVPTSDIAKSFESVAGPMIDMIVCLNKATAVLAASRDLLVPRLLSGELLVATAERELEAAA